MTFWNNSLRGLGSVAFLLLACGNELSGDSLSSLDGDKLYRGSDSDAESRSGNGSEADDPELNSADGTAFVRDIAEDDAIEVFPDSGSCDVPGLAVPMLRRLSHVEYRNTLRDLLGEAVLSEVSLLSDSAISGFENNARALGASAVLVEQYASQARGVAKRLAELEMADCESGLEPGVECGDYFVENFGSRAFRRPLSFEELGRYSEFFAKQKQALGLPAALALTAEALLQSPGFLYRIEVPKLAATLVSSVGQPYALASRISYLLWQTMPDQTLFDAAAAGELSTPEQLAIQARRMLQDPRAAETLVDFHRQWLGLGRVLDETKDEQRFPLWQADTAQDALEESLRFVQYVYSQAEGNVDSLLTDRTAFVNEAMAELYEVDYDYVSGEEWQQVQLPSERAGILSRAAFLAGFSHPAGTSPPLRGVAVLDKLLCSRPPPAPASADTSTPTAEQGIAVTTRELFVQRTEPAQCQGCHLSINGIGMAFEEFDTIGRYRTEENGLPVDASGQLFLADSGGQFDGIVELSERLSQSQQVQGCAVKNIYRNAFGQTETGQDRCRLEQLEQAMIEHNGDLREVLVALVSSAQFAGRAKPLSLNTDSLEEK